MKLSLKRLGVGLTGNVVLLAVASFFTDMSSEVIFPLLPIFMVGTLGATYFIVGIMEGLAELVSSIIKVFSGFLSDRTGKRKAFIASGYAGSAITKLFFSISTIWQHVFLLRIAERVGKGCREPPRDALVAESTTPDRTGKAFGFQRAMDTGGAIVGPILGIAMLTVFAMTFEMIFLVAAIPAFIAFIVVLFLREKRKERKIKYRLKIGLKHLPVRLRVFVVIATIFALGQFSFFFVMLRAVDLGQSDASTLFFYLLLNISFAVSAVPVGSLSDRIGRIPAIAVGYVLFATMCLLFVFEIGPSLIALAFILFGLSNGFVDGVQRAFVCDLSPEEIRGTCLGTYHMSIGIGKLFSGLIVGALWTFIGVQYAFMYGVILPVMAATMLASLLKIPTS